MRISFECPNAVQASFTLSKRAFLCLGLVLTMFTGGCSTPQANANGSGSITPASSGDPSGGNQGGNDGSSPGQIVPNAPISGYHLTFDDEFNSLSVSNDPYLYHTLWCSCSWWGPGHGTTNLQVQNGILQMSVNKGPTGDLTGTNLSTWSPTATSFSQRYGYWETRIKMSGQKGIFATFYLISEENILTDGAYPSNEIDVFEKPKGDTIFLTLHDGTASGPAESNHLQVPDDFDQSFHTIGVLWTPDSGYIQWFIDGQLVSQEEKFTGTDMSPMIMTLQATVFDVFGTPDSTTQFPAVTQVDYVRVFSNDPSLPLWTAQQ